jgi:hypothetical protein
VSSIAIALGYQEVPLQEFAVISSGTRRGFAGFDFALGVSASCPISVIGPGYA